MTARAAPEFQEWPTTPFEFVWTEEYEKDVQELKELVKRLEEQQDDADEK